MGILISTDVKDSHHEEQRIKFETIARPYKERLYRTALILTKSPREAEKLTNETFVHARKTSHKLESDSDFGYWLSTILVSTIKGRARREKIQNSYREKLTMQNWVNNFVLCGSQESLKEFESQAFLLMDRLYNAALRITRGRLDAEDLVQDTYLKAYRYFHRFERGSNMHAWMLHILTNIYITQYNRKKRQPDRVNFETACTKVPQENSNEFNQEQGCEFTRDYEELFDDTITAALNRLPEKYRIVVLLSDISDLKYKEIAEVLACPIGTVMSRLSRGRKILARFLKKYAATNGFTKHSFI